tara:strand:+ start:8781 stop:8975 length:195 start_codon:yes stop_codon:yes gene_type:complete
MTTNNSWTALPVPETKGGTNQATFTTGDTVGCRDSAADVDAVRFLMKKGNIASGSIRMYGIANS